MADLSIAVLAGGSSHEREVSLRSGRRLSSALREHNLVVEEWDTDDKLVRRLRTEQPDAAVVALHGGEGENGSVQTILEMLDVPFVGSGSRACRRGWDKPTGKAVVSNAGFTTPDWVALPHSTFRELGTQDVLNAMVERLGLPLILKPDQGGSALGMQVVRDAADLPAAMMGCFSYGDNVLAERFIDGVEVAVTVIEGDEGPQAVPAVEIVAENGLYDYTARYTAGLTDFFTPARVAESSAAAAADLAVTAHRLLGLRDISRTDAIVDPDGVVHFLEVNLSPGLTETSTMPMGIEASGGVLGSVFTELVNRAVTRGA